jgi:hypothetical protein
MKKKMSRADVPYLCQYDNCQIRRPMRETFIVGYPRSGGGGAKRYCSAEHTVLALRNWKPLPA